MFHIISKEIKNICRKDPACAGNIFEVFLCYPGFQAMLVHRFNHFLWTASWGPLTGLIRFVIRVLAHITKILTGIEIHPAAVIGEDFFIDHGTGVVIGETTIIGDNVTLYQGVTLGGVSTQKTKRHPTLGSNIIVGAGAKVLGNINIGDYVQVGANSVVLKDIPDYSTVVGIPGRIVKMDGKGLKAIENLEHGQTPDFLGSAIQALTDRIDELEAKLKE